MKQRHNRKRTQAALLAVALSGWSLPTLAQARRLRSQATGTIVSWPRRAGKATILSMLALTAGKPDRRKVKKERRKAAEFYGGMQWSPKELAVLAAQAEKSMIGYFARVFDSQLATSIAGRNEVSAGALERPAVSVGIDWAKPGDDLMSLCTLKKDERGFVIMLHTDPREDLR